MKKSRLSTSDFTGLSRALDVSFAAVVLSVMLMTGRGDGGLSTAANPSDIAANADNATIQPVMAAMSPDQPYVDPNVCGTRSSDALAANLDESAAITHHTATIGGESVTYTATAGHLAIIDPVTSRSNATMLYVAYTQDNPDSTKSHSVTFFYNGGPGSSSTFLLPGSFGLRWLQLSFPNFTSSASYKLPDSPDGLLDRPNLMFINPVGTGYSTVIASAKSKDLWDTDQDACLIDRSTQCYLTRNPRWNSSKFLYGKPRDTICSTVLPWVLCEGSTELDGIMLQSSILDYANTLPAVDTFPTLATNVFYWKKTMFNPAPTGLGNYMIQVRNYADNTLAPLVQVPSVADGGSINVYLNLNLATTQTMGSYIGTDPVSLTQAFGNSAALGNVPSQNNNPPYTFFLTLNPGIQISQYDGYVSYTGQDIASFILPNSGSNDPPIPNIGDTYMVLWSNHLNTQLRYASASLFADLNDAAFNNWNFSHIDPTGANGGGGNMLYTIGDLAATMSLNSDLKVLQAGGYFDAVTPSYRTELMLAQMPLDPILRTKNLTIKNCPSGHTIYLSDVSCTALRGDLASFYDSVMAGHSALMRVQNLQRLLSGSKK